MLLLVQDQKWSKNTCNSWVCSYIQGIYTSINYIEKIQIIFSINDMIKVWIHNKQSTRKSSHIEILKFSIKLSLAQGKTTTDNEIF